MFKAFLIKYAEIAIKGKNRYIFEDALVDQIRHVLKEVDGEFSVVKERGRIYVYADSEFDYDLPDCSIRGQRLRRVIQRSGCLCERDVQG